MSTSEETDRWQHVLAQATIPFDVTIRAMRSGGIDSFPHAQAVEVAIAAISGPVLGHWAVAQPADGSQLHAVISPVVEAVRAFDASDLSLNQVTNILDMAKGARDQLAAGLHDPETADEVVSEMIADLKALVVAARLGHRGIMELLSSQWDRRIAGMRKGRVGDVPRYFDVMKFESTDVESATTIPFSDLLASVHPGVATVAEYMEQFEVETETEIQSQFAGRWVVTFFTEWELNYRRRLAKVHGCPERAVRSTLMRDLGFMRNDYAHNRGIASSKQKKCKRLKWFEPGERMQPLQRHYQELFEEFETEREALAAAPAPYKTNKVELKGNVPQELADSFNSVAAELGVGNDEALAAAVAAWCESNE
ncbi:MAG: hypothetical protein CME34_14175 [Gordonia sp.]|uniref:hypothetical protein n=1 Tax=Gordonia sp. (in: high G+C Gram-positive bacteria) TaxID=84139 RepID=UPI000C3C55A3|nr:hypothetical protein [Gordonia sp. (in: high G+C Gram-positive bacteria)]MAU82990.1 hypothetical protein [Gordonia sp. (in: high G+C Gram-positive bacteria)]